MSQPANHLYEFGAYRLDPVQKLLFRDGKPVPVTVKALEVLAALVESRGRLVAKEQLMKAVWPDTFVEEGNLTFHIHALRKALEDQTSEHNYIETIPRRGYRLVAEVREVVAPASEERFESATEQTAASERAHEGLVAVAPVKSLNRWRLPLGIAVFAVAALALLVVVWRMSSPQPAASAPLLISPFTSFPGGVQSPAFSPDGEQIAFSWTGAPGTGNWSIYVKLIGAAQPLRLTNDAGADMAPTWAPDGKQIAFVRERGNDKTVGIYVVSAMGGSEHKLIDVNYARYFDLAWSPDGKLIAYAEKMSPQLPYDDLNSYAIKLLDVVTLEKRQLTFPNAKMSDHRFAFSPDGKTLAFLRHGFDAGVGIFTISVAGGPEKQIHTEPAWAGNLAWAADGKSIIFTSTREGGSKFWRVNLSGGEPTPLPLAEEMAFDPTISRSGNRFAYVREYADSDLYQVDLAPPNAVAKSPLPIEASARVETCPVFSPDGTKLAFLSDRSGKREVWMSDADGSNSAQLTDFFAWGTTAPSWSADSKELMFFAGHGPGGTKGGIFVMNVKDKNIRRVPVEGSYVTPQWSHDGKWIYAASGTASDGQLWKLPMDGGSPILLAGEGAGLPQESPDGRYVYFVKWPQGIYRVLASGGKPEVVLQKFSSMLMEHWQIMNDGLFFVNDASVPYATIEFLNFATKKTKLIVELTGAPTAYNGGLTVSANRKKIVYSQDSRSGSDIMLVENFR